MHKCIEGLKKGKAVGLDGLMAEHMHIYFAHPIVWVHLALLFSLLHSMVPDDFGRGVIIPLLKNVDGNKFSADNYRGITLSPVISKLFKAVLKLLSQCKDQLMCDPLQFGFKRKSSCSHAIFTYKTVVDYYVKHNCTVNIITCIGYFKSVP